MKYVCMNYEKCDYYDHITVTPETPPFQTCPYCLSLLVLIPSNVNIEELLADGIKIELLDND